MGKGGEKEKGRSAGREAGGGAEAVGESRKGRRGGGGEEEEGEGRTGDKQEARIDWEEVVVGGRKECRGSEKDRRWRGRVRRAGREGEGGAMGGGGGGEERSLTQVQTVDAQSGVAGVVQPPLLPPAAGGVGVHLAGRHSCRGSQ